jgi:hypothetical protein
LFAFELANLHVNCAFLFPLQTHGNSVVVKNPNDYMPVRFDMFFLDLKNEKRVVKLACLFEIICHIIIEAAVIIFSLMWCDGKFVMLRLDCSP